MNCWSLPVFFARQTQDLRIQVILLHFDLKNFSLRLFETFDVMHCGKIETNETNETNVHVSNEDVFRWGSVCRVMHATEKRDIFFFF